MEILVADLQLLLAEIPNTPKTWIHKIMFTYEIVTMIKGKLSLFLSLFLLLSLLECLLNGEHVGSSTLM